MLERAIGALIIFGVGLNVIYFGCIENGSNNLRNPTWGFLSGFISLENAIVLVAVGGAILAAARWALLGVGSLILRIWQEAREERQAVELRRKEYQPFRIPSQSAMPVMSAAAVIDRHEPAHEVTTFFEQETLKLEPKSIPRELSDDIKKQNAIQDILGRR